MFLEAYSGGDRGERRRNHVGKREAMGKGEEMGVRKEEAGCERERNRRVGKGEESGERKGGR